jgi:DNA primase
MREWLNDRLLSAHHEIPEEAEGYVIGRGLSEALFRSMGVGVWKTDLTAPDPSFQKLGKGGAMVEGWLSIPIRNPVGKLLGVEFRTWQGEKKVRKFFLPEAQWSPVFYGNWPLDLHKVWEGGDVWVVEGIFDMCVSKIVPDKDVVLSTGGAALSSDNLEFLSRFLSRRAYFNLVYDNDETGRRQATGFNDEKTGRRVPGVPERLKRVGINCRVIRYSGGKDPGEIWNSGGTPALRKAFNLGV